MLWGNVGISFVQVMAFGLFKKKKKEDTDDRYHQLKIKEVRQVAKDTVNLIFEKPTKAFNYKPGQFITIIEKVNGKKVRRAYSLCSSPYLDEHPIVTVKRVTGGVMSNHINDEFAVGQLIEVMEPMGLFTTDFDESKTRNAVFFGGGSGITPLYSIMRSMLAKEPNCQVTLIYGNQNEEYIIFKKELEELDQQHENFTLLHVLEESEDKSTKHKGKPTHEMVTSISSELGVDQNTEFFVCGPEGMMEVVVDGLKKAGMEDHQIKMESFEAGKTSPQEIIDPEAPSTKTVSELTMVLDGESYSLTLDKSRPILEQALENDIDMPYSCQSGLCTACRSLCVEGEISIDDAEGLTQEELDEGYVLTCVGKAISDHVKIEVG